MVQTYKNFDEFYNLRYIPDHSDIKNRRFHVVGTALGLLLLLKAIILGPITQVLLVPIALYGFAWLGHFIFERNKPATWEYPYWSLLSDLRMMIDIV